jgi:hypothetical protein
MMPICRRRLNSVVATYTSPAKPAPETLLGADAQQIAPPRFLFGVFGNLDDRNEFGVGASALLAARVPIDVVAML